MERKGKTVIAMRGRPLSPKRTEYGKAIRKAYEKKEIQERRANIQKLEPRSDGICNTITTVTKDNLILGRMVRMELPNNKVLGEEDYDDRWENTPVTDEDVTEVGESVDDYLYHASDGEWYGIFKLSPRECLRLMDVRDDDIDKMLSVNSRSQCYKQAGNSIVVSVLAAIFSQLNIQGIKPWNDRTHDERKEFLGFRPKKSDEQL